jgi:hypothetical protein
MDRRLATCGGFRYASQAADIASLRNGKSGSTVAVEHLAAFFRWVAISFATNATSAGNPAYSGMISVSDPERNSAPETCFRHSEAQYSASSLDEITRLRRHLIPGHG